ncbi:MAG: DUF4258 domain-containing protein [Bacteriovoracaceae bacterium]|jgi:hypothetical protein|nr:DUF4258 domain-containing protein [Bacteriovoracaceae bacterium]
MLQVIKFKKKSYKLVFTKHALDRMSSRNISRNEVITVVQEGKIVDKELDNKYWVYKNFKKRTDNNLCISISIEEPSLIIITALVNWRMKL